MRLTFASYNIHKGVGLDRRRDPERILNVLNELDADVVALQEADLRFGSRAAVLPRRLLEEHRWHFAALSMKPAGMAWHGNAILVRRGIEIVGAEPIALPVLEPRGAVCAHLRVQEQETGFLPNASPTIVTPPAESAGERIGPYKLLQHIGEGGFGTVWMAEQVEQTISTLREFVADAAHELHTSVPRRSHPGQRAGSIASRRSSTNASSDTRSTMAPDVTGWV